MQSHPNRRPDRTTGEAPRPTPAPQPVDFDDPDLGDAGSATECTGMIPARPRSEDAAECYNQVLSYLPPEPPHASPDGENRGHGAKRGRRD